MIEYLTFIIASIYAAVVLGTYAYIAFEVWFTHEDTPERNIHFDRSPKVSIIVPAYNEEVTIIDSMESMLEQDYHNFDICVINDGSTDNSLKKVIDYFKLKEILNIDYLNKKLENHSNITSSKIKSAYSNGTNILLLYTDNGGKANALNTGMLCTESEYVINIDADTFIVKDALSTTLKKKKDGMDVISCMVGVMNGSKVEHGQIKIHELPKKIIPRLQWIDYVKSFIIWSIPNVKYNLTLVVSGAFAFMKKSAVLKVGGYKHKHPAEDMEITLNILNNKGKIQFIPEFLAWTEVPEDMTSLTKQRLRWYRGGIMSIVSYKNLLLNIKHSKRLSMFILPFVWLTEVIGPWIELISWIQLIIYIIIGKYINWDYFIYFWSIVLIVHCLYMATLMRFVQVKLKKEHWKLKLYRTILPIALEMVTYNFIRLYWVIKSHTSHYLNLGFKWNKPKRKGFKNI